MSTPDFWGEIGPVKMRTPVSILREQASILGTKTKNLIEGEVITANQGGRFYHSMNLVVPVLGNYRYTLFTVTHEIGLYPVTVTEGRYSRISESEDDFLEWLRAKLSGPETKRIIEALLAQTEAS
jgi:hypothetical protein